MTEYNNEFFERILALPALAEAKYEPKSRIAELYDYLSMDIPDHMRPAQPTEAEVEQKVDAFRKKHEGFIAAAEAYKGSSVKCRCVSDGALCRRLVLIYPGMELLGAEKAEKAVIGHKVGDAVDTVLNGKPVTLDIIAITRPNDEGDEDEMVRAENIEGVTTMAQYREKCREDVWQMKLEKSAREVAGMWFTKLLECSKFDIDEDEKAAWLDERIMMKFNMELESGNEKAIEISRDPEKLAELKADWMSQQVNAFEEYLGYYAISNANGKHIGRREAAQVIFDSAKGMELTFEESLKRINMRYLLEAVYLGYALEILKDQAKERLV